VTATGSGVAVPGPTDGAGRAVLGAGAHGVGVALGAGAAVLDAGAHVVGVGLGAGRAADSGVSADLPGDQWPGAHG
jgi:hypothetical protein